MKEKIDDAEKRKQDAELDQRKNADEISRIENRKTKKETEIKKERKKVKFFVVFTHSNRSTFSLKKQKLHRTKPNNSFDSIRNQSKLITPRLLHAKR